MRAGTLIVDIAANLARLQQDMGQAKSLVQSTAKDIERSVNIAKSALAGLGVVGAVGLFANEIRQTIKWQADLHDLGLKTGMTASELSKLTGIAKLAGTEMNDVGVMAQKLSKSMAEVGDKESKAGKVFEALGISVKKANGELRPTSEVMQDLSRKLVGMEDKTLALAYAQAVLGKSGANLLPFMHELAEAGTLVAKVTDEQAAAADRYEDNLVKMTEASQKAKIALANDLLPTLIDITDEMVKAREEGEGFFGMLARGWQQLTTGSDLQKARAELVGLTNDILTLQNRIDAAKLHPNVKRFPGMLRRDEGALAEAQERAGEVRRYIQSIEGDEERRAAERAAKAAARGTRVPNVLNTGSTEKEKDDYTSLSKSVDERIALLKAERDATLPLTDAQKELAKLLVDIEGGYKSLTPVQIESLKARLQEADQLEQANKAKKEAAKLDLEIFNARRQYLDEMERGIVTGEEEIKRLRESNEEIGLTTEQLGKLRVARMDEAISRAEQNRMAQLAGGADEAEIRNLDRRIEQLKQIRDLTRDGNFKTQAAETRKAQEDEQKKTNDHIQRTLTDALMRGFEKGGEQGAAKLVRIVKDAAWNMSRTLIIEPMIRPFMSGVAGSVGSMFGMSANAAGNGILTNGGGIGGGMYGTGIMGGITAMSAGADSVFQNAGSYFGSQSIADIGNFGYGMPVLGGLATYAMTGNAGAGIGSTLGGIAGSYFGPLGSMAGSAIGGMIGGALFGDDGGPQARYVGVRGGFGQDAGIGVIGTGKDLAYNDVYTSELAAKERSLISRLGLSGDDVGRVSAALSTANVHTQVGEFHTRESWWEDDYGKKILAERLNVVSKTIGRSIEELTATMMLSSEQWDMIQEQQRVSLERQRAPLLQLKEILQLQAGGGSGLDVARLQLTHAGKPLGSAAGGVDTMSEWQAAFASAIGSGDISAEAIQQWQSLGAVIQNVTALTVQQIAEDARRAAELANLTEEQRQMTEAERELAAGRREQYDELRRRESDLDAQRGAMGATIAGTLGIGQLEAYRDSLATSDAVSPLDRVAAARSIFDSTLGRARSGELDAVRGFPEVAQTLLQVGRDAYASGPAFQAMFTDVNRALSEILDRQRSTRDDMFGSLQLTMQQVADNELAALKQQTMALVTELKGIRNEITLLAAAA